MSVSINVQYIKQARARKISPAFSTVQLSTKKPLDNDFFDDEVSLFIEGPGHEDAAARIAALINEQVIRRDKPAEPLSTRCFTGDDGPTYEDEGGIPDPSAPPDGPTDQWEAGRLDAEQAGELKAALPIREAAEEAAYNAEDEAGKEEYRRQHAED